MELANAQVKQTGANSYSVYHGSDSGLYVEFFNMPEYQEFESQQKGYPIHKDIEMVRIFTPGKNQPFTRRVNALDAPNQPGDSRRWPNEYRAFKDQAKVSHDGMAIEMWPILTPSQALNMKALNIHTVEMLANVSDNVLDNIGMGARDLREKAKTFIAKATDSSVVTKLQSENDTLKADIQMLKKQVEELGKQKKETK